uniref:Uncharacterized protein n=1 Tax=Cucumis melo TaxID=3656 RepID=A0A9I9EIY3_CUCME
MNVDHPQKSFFCSRTSCSLFSHPLSSSELVGSKLLVWTHLAEKMRRMYAVEEEAEEEERSVETRIEFSGGGVAAIPPPSSAHAKFFTSPIVDVSDCILIQGPPLIFLLARKLLTSHFVRPQILRFVSSLPSVSVYLGLSASYDFNSWVLQNDSFAPFSRVLLPPDQLSFISCMGYCIVLVGRMKYWGFGFSDLAQYVSIYFHSFFSIHYFQTVNPLGLFHIYQDETVALHDFGEIMKLLSHNLKERVPCSSDNRI